METRRQTQRVNKWLAFAISTIVTMVDFGLIFSFGALFVEIKERFQTDRSKTATVQSLLIGVALSFGIFSGVFISKLGLPVVMFLASVLVPLGFCTSFIAEHVTFIYIAIGIVSAIGISMAYISSVAVIGREFSGSQQTLCLAILNTSYVVTSIIYPYFLEWSTRLYGLNGTFLILGGMSCNTFLLFLVCVINSKNTSEGISYSNSDMRNNTDNTDGIQTGTSQVQKANALFCKIKQLTTIPYVSILVATAFSLASLDGFVGLLLDITLWKQRSVSQTLLPFLIFNSSSAISSLIPGLLKQKKGINSCIYPIVSALTGCSGQLLVYLSTSLPVYMIGTSLSGIAYGGIISSSMNAVVRIVNSELVPEATGLLITVEGLLAAGVGPLFGSVRDATGSYSAVLVATSTALAISSASYLLALVCRKLSNDKEAAESTTEIFTVHL